MWIMRVNHIGDLQGIVVKGFSIGIVCVLLVSCDLMGWGESLEQKAEEQAAEEEFGDGLDLGEPDSEGNIELEFDLSDPGSDGGDLITGPSEPCPTTATTYYLWYDHTCVLNMSSQGVEIYYEETSEINPFVLTIESDGNVNHRYDPRLNEGDVEADVFLDMKAHVISDSGSCPITNYTGRYPIRAEITGRCEDGLVELLIRMEKIDVNITGDCQLSSGLELPGTTSAPEINHIFVHREIGDAYLLEVPAGGALAGVPGSVNCTYLFVLQPAYLGAPEDLELVPLVLPGE
jgi:hypothetical protein